MDRQEYLVQLDKAHREELLGEAIGGLLCERFGEGWPYYYTMQRLSALERHTAEVLAPLMKRYSLSMADPAQVLETARPMADFIESWPAMMAFFREALPPIVDVFEEMVTVSDAEDRPAMDFLIRHEQALLRVSQAVNDEEHQTAMDHVNDLIEEAKTLVNSTAP